MFVIVDVELVFLYNKGELFRFNVICIICGNKGYNSERCWIVIGYLKWYIRLKKFFYKYLF